MVAGSIVAGPWVRLACQRHLRDLAHGPARGLRWSRDLAEQAISFFPEILRLAEGEHAGKPFDLQPWQQFLIGSLFGWLAADGFRRFRTCYAEIGKGNGKSPLAAGVGLYGLVADGEAAAQIYSAATTREQAKIVWGDAQKMVEASAVLKARITETVNNLAFLEMGSFFRPVASDSSKLDGFRPHIVIADEVHEHPNGKVIDKMRAGFKGRRQPLMIEITNSGFDRHSICWQHRQYSEKVLEGVVENDSWFAYVCGLDPAVKAADGTVTTPADDWRDPAVWVKANPNLGVSVTAKYLGEQVQEACDMPSKENIVRRLNFCEWTESSTRWITTEAWDKNAEAIPLEELVGRPCYGGLDLASTTDLAALVLAFPLDDKRHALLCRFWCPENGLQKRVAKDRVEYDVWARQGFLLPTSGNVIDYEAIRAEIKALGARHAIKELAVDRWNSSQLVAQLQEDGLPVITHGQGYASMNAPTKAFEGEVLAARLCHGGHPVLRWNASNVVVEQDAAGNLKPNKEKSTEKIDGIVAAIMALGRSLIQPEAKGSIYERRGVRSFG